MNERRQRKEAFWGLGHIHSIWVNTNTAWKMHQLRLRECFRVCWSMPQKLSPSFLLLNPSCLVQSYTPYRTQQRPIVKSFNMAEYIQVGNWVLWTSWTFSQFVWHFVAIVLCVLCFKNFFTNVAYWVSLKGMFNLSRVIIPCFIHIHWWAWLSWCTSLKANDAKNCFVKDSIWSVFAISKRATFFLLLKVH